MSPTSENLIDNTFVANNAPEIDLSPYSATTISGMIAQASANVISYCQLDGFKQQTITAERERAHINSAGDLVISFRRRPVAQGAVTGVRLLTVGVNQSLTLQSGGFDVYFIPRPGTYMVYPSNYLISFGRGLLALRGANLFYEVDYTGGYSTVPYDIQEATLLYFRDILAKRYNQFGMDMVQTGAVRMQTRRLNALTMFIDQARDILDNGGWVRYTP